MKKPYIIKKTGFTLMELLLAVMLFSIIAVAIYSSLGAGIRIHKRGATLGGEYADIRLFFHRVAQDLRTAVSVNNVYLVGESQKIYFFSCQPATGGGSELFKITYDWKRDGDYFNLFRLRETYIDSLQAARSPGEELLDKILELDFKYGYMKKTITGEHTFLWKDEAMAEALPRLVRVSVEIAKGKFREVIYCPAGRLGEIKEE